MQTHLSHPGPAFLLCMLWAKEQKASWAGWEGESWEGVLTRTKELPWPTLVWGRTSGAEFFLEDLPLLVAEAPEQFSAWLLFSTCCVPFFFPFVRDRLSTEKEERRGEGGGGGTKKRYINLKCMSKHGWDIRISWPLKKEIRRETAAGWWARSFPSSVPPQNTTHDYPQTRHIREHLRMQRKYLLEPWDQ